MARFYGSIQGNRGPATRMGTPKSGLYSWTAGWQGKVAVELYDIDGRDMVHVSLAPHAGHGVNRVLFNGPVDGKPR
jgi:hypothetical protein